MGDAPGRLFYARMPIMQRAAVVVIIISACTLLLFSALQRVPDPPGADGYYYLKQIESLCSGSGYYYKDRSLAFLVPATFTVLTGNALDALRLSIAVTAALLIMVGGLLAFVLAAAAELTGRARVTVSLVSAFALACSLTVYEFTFEYYKNAFALLLLMSSLIVMYGCPTDAKRRPFIAALLVIGAFLSHKSTIFFVMVYALLWFLRNITRRNFVILLVLGAVSLATFLVFFEQGRYYLLALPAFLTQPVPWLDWLGYTMRKDVALFITLGTDFLTVAFYVLHRGEVPMRVALLFDSVCVVCAAAFIPFFTPGPAGPVYRVLLFSPLFLLPVMLIGMVRTNSRNMMIGTGVVLVLFLSQVFIDHNRLSSHFASWSCLDKEIGLLSKHVTLKDHLIAHHGLEFYVDYRTGIRARQFVGSDDRKRCFRLAYIPDGRPGGIGREALNSSKLEQIGDSYALFSEEDWQYIVVHYRIKPHWKNPTAVRPDYIPDYK